MWMKMCLRKCLLCRFAGKAAGTWAMCLRAARRMVRIPDQSRMESRRMLTRILHLRLWLLGSTEVGSVSIGQKWKRLEPNAHTVEMGGSRRSSPWKNESALLEGDPTSDLASSMGESCLPKALSSLDRNWKLVELNAST